MSLTADRRDWEALAAVDPLWAVASIPGKRLERWDLDEFFATGEREITEVMRVAEGLGYPRDRRSALDFGCGVGRLTRALARRFETVVGFDISARMVAEAERLNEGIRNCRFLANDAGDLRAFASDSFEMVYSSITLQHVSDSQALRSYLRELARVVRPDGLLAFQLPTQLPRLIRLRLRNRAYRLLRAIGLSERFLYRRLGLFSMELNALPVSEVTAELEKTGARVLTVVPDNRVGTPSIPSATYFATK